MRGRKAKQRRRARQLERQTLEAAAQVDGVATAAASQLAAKVPEEVGRSYWHVMRYGCDSGDPEHEVDFYLEVGCEGPRDGEPVPMILSKDHPFRAGETIQADRTSTGRMVVPVPFVAARFDYPDPAEAKHQAKYGGGPCGVPVMP